MNVCRCGKQLIEVYRSSVSSALSGAEPFLRPPIRLCRHCDYTTGDKVLVGPPVPDSRLRWTR